jgi:hypothetical protein
MDSGVRERRTEPAPFTPRPNAGKRRCLVLLRVTGRGFRVLPDIALRILNPANRHSVGETPVQVLKSEKAALFLFRASP